MKNTAYCAGVAGGHTAPKHSAGFKAGIDAERVNVPIPCMKQPCYRLKHVKKIEYKAQKN
jgi:hypothetical protein